MMEKELPHLELPEEWMVGTDISKNLLQLYTNFPCRLKSEIFVLCKGGEIEASVNLNRITVKANDFMTIMPGSIFQIHKVDGDIKIYFGGFSSLFIEKATPTKEIVKTMFFTIGHPLVHLLPEGASLVEDLFNFLIKVYCFFDEQKRKNISPLFYHNIHAMMSAIYQEHSNRPASISKSEQISRNFMQLVTQNYTKTRSVSWYAHAMNISQAHLCTTVKQVTGNTCIDLIAKMVIMDAKSQLKLSTLPVQDIAESLSFSNMSFFGKYFKRYVGMSPQEYRNNA